MFDQQPGHRRNGARLEYMSRTQGDAKVKIKPDAGHLPVIC
jgi:hypothetical protein